MVLIKAKCQLQDAIDELGTRHEAASTKPAKHLHVSPCFACCAAFFILSDGSCKVDVWLSRHILHKHMHELKHAATWNGQLATQSLPDVHLYQCRISGNMGAPHTCFQLRKVKLNKRKVTLTMSCVLSTQAPQLLRAKVVMFQMHNTRIPDPRCHKLRSRGWSKFELILDLNPSKRPRRQTGRGSTKQMQIKQKPNKKPSLNNTSNKPNGKKNGSMNTICKLMKVM